MAVTPIANFTPGSLVKGTKPVPSPHRPGQFIQENKSYRIQNLLGSGGAGNVYKAVDLQDGKFVALKVLSSDVPIVQQTFFREMAITIELDHPNIVRTHEVIFTERKVPVLSMELLQGKNLESYRRSYPGRRLSEDQSLLIGLKIAMALEYAHGQGLMHRDVKTENVMICPDRDEGQVVKLLDFGIARSVNATPGGNGSYQQLTQPGIIMGTPEYMAPERWEGRPDRASDIYALGVLMYLLIEGTHPFESSMRQLDELKIGPLEKSNAIKFYHLRNFPAPMRHCDNPLIAGLIESMLAKDLAHRPPAHAVVETLQALVRDSSPTLVLDTGPMDPIIIKGPIRQAHEHAPEDFSDGTPRLAEDEVYGDTQPNPMETPPVSQAVERNVSLEVSGQDKPQDRKTPKPFARRTSQTQILVGKDIRPASAHPAVSASHHEPPSGSGRVSDLVPVEISGEFDIDKVKPVKPAEKVIVNLEDGTRPSPIVSEPGFLSPAPSSPRSNVLDMILALMTLGIYPLVKALQRRQTPAPTPSNSSPLRGITK